MSVKCVPNMYVRHIVNCSCPDWPDRSPNQKCLVDKFAVVFFAINEMLYAVSGWHYTGWNCIRAWRWFVRHWGASVYHVHNHIRVLVFVSRMHHFPIPPHLAPPFVASCQSLHCPAFFTCIKAPSKIIIIKILLIKIKIIQIIERKRRRTTTNLVRNYFPWFVSFQICKCELLWLCITTLLL